MASRPERGVTASELLVYLVAFLAAPFVPLSSGCGDPAMAAALWIGIFGTSAFAFRTGVGRVHSLSGCLMLYLAMAGLSGLGLTLFFTATLAGALVSIRRQNRGSSRRTFLPALRSAMSATVVLRLTALLYERSDWLASRTPGFLEMMAVAALLLAFSTLTEALLTRIATLDARPATRGAMRQLLFSYLLPLFAMPFLLPALESLTNLAAAGSPTSACILTLVLGVVALLAGQLGALLLFGSLQRSARELRAEESLVELSLSLAASESPVEMLRHLSCSWARAGSPSSARASWKGFSYAFPVSGPPDQAPDYAGSGKGGLLLELWGDKGLGADPTRLEAFLGHADTALSNLRLKRKVSDEAWKCLETIVYSLDLTDRRAAGHSRRVATVTSAICRQMKLHRRLVENLRMAAMLHHAGPLLVSRRGEADIEDIFTGELRDLGELDLPPEVLGSIEHIAESFDGTGRPDSLSGNDIPLGARILAVSDAFVSSAEQGSLGYAMDEIELRSGTLYDPTIVSILSALVEKGNHDVVGIAGPGTAGGI